MTWQWTPYILPLLLATVVLTACALYLFWRYWGRPTAKVGVVLILASALWMLTAALEMASADLPSKVFWNKAQFVGICPIPIAWLALTAMYTGRTRWLTVRSLALLAFIPIFILLLVFSNESHGLIWSSIGLDTSGPFTVMVSTHGVGLWAFIAYSYLLILIGVFFLFQALVFSGQLYRWQAGALLVVVIVLWLINFISEAFAWDPIPGIELTPIALAVTVPVVAWSLNRLRFQDIMPVARTAVLEDMADAVLVIDANDRLVDLNTAAQGLIGRSRAGALGMPMVEIWPQWSSWIVRAPEEIHLQREIVMDLGDGKRYLDMRVSHLADWRGQLVSQVVVLRDITDLERRTSELSTLLETSRAVSSTLELTDVLLTLAKRLLRVSGFHICTISELDQDNDCIRVLVEHVRAVWLRKGRDAYQIRDYPSTRKVLETGEPVVIRGGEDDPETRWMGEIGLECVLMLPLCTGEETIGLVEVCSTDGEFASDPVTIKNCQEILQDMASWLKSPLRSNSPEALLEAAGQIIGSCAGSMCCLSDWDTSGGVVRSYVEHADSSWPSGEGPIYRLKDWSSTTDALKGGISNVLRLSDLSVDSEDREHMARWGAHTLVIQPVSFKGKSVGLVELFDVVEERQVSESELLLWLAIGDQAAVAMDNARLYQEARRQLQEQTALRKAAAVISSALDPDVVLTQIVEQMCRSVDATSAYISSYEPETMRAMTLAEYISPQACAEERDSDLGYVYQEDDPKFLETMLAGRHDISHVDNLDLQDYERQHMQRYGAKTILYVPLRIREQVIGYVEIWESRRRREFTSGEIAMCHGIAQQAAIALENARLYEETQRQLRSQIALREAGELISSALDTKAILTRLAEQICKTVNATSAYICDYNTTTMEAVELAEYYSPFACPQERVSDLAQIYIDVEDDPEFIRIMESGQHDVSHVDEPGLTSIERTHMQTFGAKTILYIPLISKGRLIGFTEVWESRHKREFSPDEIGLCHDISRQAAIALENARLYEQAQEEITKRRQVEGQIRASLAEKEILLKEVHHRVKNNLQVISSLINLQVGQIMDPLAISAFVEIQQRIRSMALIHEKLYSSQDLGRVDFSEYAQSLAQNLLHTYADQSKKVSLKVDCDPVYLSIDEAVTCGLLVNELVTNALKHAFPENCGGSISICLKELDSGEVALMVSDDGVGFPDEVDFSGSGTLGLQLIHTLVRQLDGQITMGVDQGTQVTVTLPTKPLGRV